MKIGMCMFLWTTAVSKRHEKLLRDIKATGFDGVEIPIFVGAPDDYKKLGELLVKRNRFTGQHGGHPVAELAHE